jgi:Tfp pilus assembly protein PilN
VNLPPGLKKWLAVGSGVGIAIEGPRDSQSLRVQAVRVRPSGVRVLGGFTVENFAQQPAAEWGAAYAAFVSKLGLRQAPAVAMLPRRDVILRQIGLPGVSDKDLDAAVAFQLDGLHPYDEAQVAASWARLPGSDAVLVAIARRETVERYATLFAEAGVPLAGFACSGPAIYSALRLFGAAPPPAILACEPSGAAVEVYGESPARTLLSAIFDVEPARAVALASAELRFEAAVEPVALGQLLKSETPLAHAAALASACPHLSLPVNLLPAGQRRVVSKLRWVPAAALGAVVLLLAGGMALLPAYQDSRYLRRLQAEIEQVQPAALRAGELDQRIAEARARVALLDELRRRPRADMDVLAALTALLPPPAWVTSLQIDARQVEISGETADAAPLLKTLDESPLFEASEFASAPARIDSGQAFRIRTRRSALPPPAPPAPPAPAEPPKPAAEPPQEETKP